MSVLQHFVVSRCSGCGAAAQIPVVEIALRPPSCLNSLHSLCFLDERLGLPPFDALAEKLTSPRVYSQLRFRNAQRQGCGDAFCDMGLLDAGDSVCDFAGDSAGRHQPPATALAFYASGERLFQPIQLRARRFHGRTAFFFLNLENLQQTPHGARNSHGSNLRGQGREPVQALGEADSLACRLCEKGAYRVARPQGAVEVRIRARLVSADAHQIFRAGVNRE